MTATATITVAEVTEALLVPNAALRFAPPQVAASGGGGGANRGGGLLGLIMPRPPAAGPAQAAPAGAAIWVLKDGVPVRVAVTAGESDGRRTAISAEGLSAGDPVVTDQREAG